MAPKVIESSNPLDPLHEMNDVESILKRGKVVVGVCKIDQPPFYERIDGSLRGHDITIAEGIADALGVKLVFNEDANNWDDLVTQLIEGKIDLAISFLSKTVARSRQILYSNHYAKVNQTVLLNRLKLAQMITRHNNTLEKIFSPKGNERLIVYEGSSYIKFAKNLFKDVNLMMFKDQDDIIKALMENKAIGFITDEIETKSYVDAHPDAKLKLLPIILNGKFDLIAVGVRPHAHQLLHLVNTYLETNNIHITINENEKNERKELLSQTPLGPLGEP